MQPFWNWSCWVPSASPNCHIPLISHYPVGDLVPFLMLLGLNRSILDWFFLNESILHLPTYFHPTTYPQDNRISFIFWGQSSEPLTLLSTSALVLLLIPTLGLFCLFLTLYIAGSQWVFFGIDPQLIKFIFLYPSQGGLATRCKGNTASLSISIHWDFCCC